MGGALENLRVEGIDTVEKDPQFFLSFLGFEIKSRKNIPKPHFCLHF